ncbi:recombinase family protein [Nocardia salmonicida]|uniref:recombinase family protein n=1 Tax=Nocardia salmonicida TaxID=53431 RepID=UPI0033D54EE0
MQIGYVSIAPDEAPDAQIAALRAVGVATADIHVDTVPTATREAERAPRPALDRLRAAASPGDTLVVTDLARLAAGLRTLVTFGAALHQAGIGLRTLGEGINTDHADGRAQLAMLGTLDRFQRGQIATGTRAGLATAKARGHKGGRPSKLTPAQVLHAQSLYDQGSHTVADIAAILGVGRATIYGHITRPTDGARRPRPRKATTAAKATPAVTSHAAEPSPIPAAEIDAPPAPVTSGATPAPNPPAAQHHSPTPAAAALDVTASTTRPARARSYRARGTTGRIYHHPSKVERFQPRTHEPRKPCPCCQTRPGQDYSPQQMVDDLTYRWLEPDPTPGFEGGLVITKHCAKCQPRDRVAVTCAAKLCENGPILGGQLATEAITSETLPPLVRRWLTAHGWHDDAAAGLICPDHDADGG